MEGQNVAIYLDFENLAISAETVYPSKNRPLNIEPLIDFASSKGNIAVRKAYADWSKQHFSRYQNHLLEQGFELIHLPETSNQGKNGSDVRLAIDVMEQLVMYPEIDTIVIGSGDTDFIPLIQRVRSRSKNVIVLGFEHSVSRLVKRNSAEFKSLEELLGKAEEESPGSDLHEDLDLAYGRDLLIRYIHSRTDDEPVLMSKLKQHLLRLDPSFSEREMGFASFKRFLQALEGDLVEKIDSQQDALPLVYLKNGELNYQKNQVDEKETARHFLSKKLRYQKDPLIRQELCQALFEGFRQRQAMSMTEMFLYLNESMQASLPKTEIRKFINTLFTGGAFEAKAPEVEGPLLSRSFIMSSHIAQPDDFDQVYIKRISEILQSRYQGLDGDDMLELLVG
ncbi:MAG: NYN domain-containing protein [Bacteroidetes bacterium]|nr:MAG: NYN domain-containing protein [Bacteroidota bacterium]